MHGMELLASLPMTCAVWHKAAAGNGHEEELGAGKSNQGVGVSRPQQLQLCVSAPPSRPKRPKVKPSLLPIITSQTNSNSSVSSLPHQTSGSVGRVHPERKIKTKVHVTKR
ncbi:uncharacterized protein BDV14DRAFT_96915 [Aspergillus stella-maris]|uniref:uncharacterized protein n=1 Tax=Aspergillus stella-maris TaxID=1810926 RepID=UPI003CCE1435